MTDNSAHKPVIGVLALQGAVMPHKAHIEACGAEFKLVKTPAHLAEIDALILPGGESTTMLKLIDRFGLEKDLVQTFKTKPIWGICAGAILIAEKVLNPKQKSYGLLPMTVTRNGYGRQLESSIEDIDGYPVSYIRAPIIEEAKGIDVKATREGKPVWVEQGKVMATTFHPELTLDTPSPMHKYFIEMI